jgi:hypothetical protein
LKKLFAFFVLLKGFTCFAQPVFKDAPAVHGMLLFGTERIYASHLPMFHSPHDYQIILEVELDEKQKKIYLQSRTKFPNETVYTIEPEKFSIPKFMENTHPIKVNVYRGHFERGGTKIMDSVTMNIVHIIHFKQFDPYAAHKKIMNFLVFGNKKEQFMAHEISASPDFDQIIKINIADKSIKRSLQNESSYFLLKITDNKNETPLPKTSVALNGEIVWDKNKALAVTVAQIVYTETGDLEM